jgi:hypothetical protein
MSEIDLGRVFEQLDDYGWLSPDPAEVADADPTFSTTDGELEVGFGDELSVWSPLRDTSANLAGTGFDHPTPDVDTEADGDADTDLLDDPDDDLDP